MPKNNNLRIYDELEEFEKALNAYIQFIETVERNSGYIPKLLDNRLCEIIESIKNELF